MPRTFITTEQIRAAARAGLSELPVPAGALVTDDAKETAVRCGLRLVRGSGRQRAPWIGANWKMNLSLAEANAYCQRLRTAVAGAEAVIFPPSLYLALMANWLKPFPVKVGAQNAHASSSGAFTGEISAAMIKEAGGTDVLVGHSERRALFGETDADVRAKVQAVLGQDLRAVLCVGEPSAVRAAGRAVPAVRQQLRSALPDAPGRLVVAYEPVWAIGTGRRASADDIADMHQRIRDELASCWGPEAEAIRVVYGGSVTPDSAGDLAALPAVDGFLVGGASLDPGKLLHIIGAVTAAKHRMGA